MSVKQESEVSREQILMQMRKNLAKTTAEFRMYRLKRLRLDILKHKKINKHAEKMFIKLNELMSAQIKQAQEIDDLFDKLEALF